jgi:hypothetical protein
MARPKTFNETFSSFFDSFIDESDRGCVIAIGALLDDMLKELLNTHLTRLSGQADFIEGMLDPHSHGMLSKFCSRVKLAVSLGIVEFKFSPPLKAIGKVRNEFAHKSHLRKLERRHVDILVGNLPGDTRDDVRRRLAGLTAFSHNGREWSVIRIEFILASVPLVLALRAAINTDKRRLRIIAKALEPTLMYLPSRKR